MNLSVTDPTDIENSRGKWCTNATVFIAFMHHLAGVAFVEE